MLVDDYLLFFLTGAIFAQVEVLLNSSFFQMFCNLVTFLKNCFEFVKLI